MALEDVLKVMNPSSEALNCVCGLPSNGKVKPILMFWLRLLEELVLLRHELTAVVPATPTIVVKQAQLGAVRVMA